VLPLGVVVVLISGLMVMFTVFLATRYK